MNFIINEVTAVAIVMGIAQILKEKESGESKTGFIPTRLIPIINMAVGLAFGFYFQPSVKEAVIVGLMIGLSACGVFDLGSGFISKETKTETSVIESEEK